MNQEQVLGLLRTLLAFGGGWAVSKGYVDNATAASIAGAIVTLAAGGWSIFAHTKGAAIATVNRQDNGAKVVAADAPAPQISVPLK